jgi:DNA primase
MTTAVSERFLHNTNRLDARELKARVGLSVVASRFTQLRRSGRQLVGLCPLHSERHPSFYVHPEKQVFHCFGCGAGGDVFAFVMRVTGCDFRRALEIVADFSKGVACASEPRSGSRFGASEGAKPLSPPKAGACYSQSSLDSRARLLAALEATNRRLRAIEAANRDASAALVTACEPDRGSLYLLEKSG